MKRKINFKREAISLHFDTVGNRLINVVCALRGSLLISEGVVVWEDLELHHKGKKGQFERATLENEFDKLD